MEPQSRTLKYIFLCHCCFFCGSSGNRFCRLCPGRYKTCISKKRPVSIQKLCFRFLQFIFMFYLLLKIKIISLKLF